MVEQMVRTEEEKGAAKAKKEAKQKPKKGKRGRPKGSKNRDKTAVTLTPELTRLQQMIQKLLVLILGMLSLEHIVMDGHFGNKKALQMVRQCGLHLTSKLRSDSALRFQIEFNFRDAKQHWGLEDFMNTKETAVTNATNLSSFMVNLSYLLLHDFRQKASTVNVLDLKAYYRGRKYVTETLKCLPQKPEPIFMARIFDRVSRLGRIHVPLPPLSPHNLARVLKL